MVNNKVREMLQGGITLTKGKLQILLLFGILGLLAAPVSVPVISEAGRPGLN